MKHKMVCIDMDGTLLSDDKNICDENKRALTELVKRGVKVVVCTGRSFVSAKYYADLIGEKVDVIASNGAVIIDSRGENLFQSKLGIENSLKVLEVVKKYKIEPHFYSLDKMYTEKMVNAALFYEAYNKTVGDVKYKVKFQLVDDWECVLRENEDDIMKVVGYHNDVKLIEKVRGILKEMSGIEVVYSHNMNFEVMDKGISKGSSIEKLAKHYGIQKAEVVVFGDSNNDYSMMEYAGVGVAMGNGTEEIKERARFVTKSNNEAGVSYGIQKIFIDGEWE